MGYTMKIILLFLVLSIPALAQSIDYNPAVRDTSITVQVADGYTDDITMSLNSRECVALFAKLGQDWRATLRSLIRDQVDKAVTQQRTRLMALDEAVPSDTTGSVQRQMRMANRTNVWQTVTRSCKVADVASVPRRP